MIQNFYCIATQSAVDVTEAPEQSSAVTNTVMSTKSEIVNSTKVPSENPPQPAEEGPEGKIKHNRVKSFNTKYIEPQLSGLHLVENLAIQKEIPGVRYFPYRFYYSIQKFVCDQNWNERFVNKGLKNSTNLIT